MRISEVFDNLHMIDNFEEEKQMDDAFEALDQESEDKILKMAMNKINQGTIASSAKSIKKRKKNRHLFNKKRLAVAVLVAAFIGTITVSAKEIGGIGKVIEAIESIVIKKPLAEKVHMDTDQSEEKIIVNDIAENDRTKVSYEGVTVSIEQVVSDGEDAYVYLSAEVPNELMSNLNESENTRLYFRQNEIQIGNNEPKKINFQLQSEQADKRYGILHVSLEEVEDAACEVSLTLNNLDFGVRKEDGSGWNIERLVEGQWNLQWNINCEKMTETYELTATIDAHDGTVTTQEVVLSPLSIRIVGTIECEDPTYSQVSCNIYYIILKDGTLEEYDSSYSQIEDGKYTMKCYFKRMIPMEDVIGVVVNDEYLYFK